MKKKWKLLTILTCLLFLFTACGKQEATNRLEEIYQKGELVVVTSPDFPPNEFIDLNKSGNEQYVGSDIELAKYIAKELGVELKLEIADFNTVLSMITTGKADLAISGLAYDEERAKSIEFSKGYYSEDGGENCHGLLIRKEDADLYQDLGSFANKKIAAQAGSIQESYTNSQILNPTTQPIAAITDGIMMLQKNKVDAIATACNTGEEYAKSYPDLMMSDVTFETDSSSGTRIGAPKGEVELIAKVDEIIDDVLDQGLYKQWYEEYTDYNAKLEAGENPDAIASAVVDEPNSMWDNIVMLITRYGTTLLKGLGITLELAAITVFFGTIFGAVFALIKLNKHPLVQALSTAYVEIIRGTPLLLQLYFFYLFLPDVIGLDIPAFGCILIALIVNSSAYVAEIIRAGIQAVDKGQREAAKSLGMSDRNMMVKIIIPQAIKNILPALGNEFIMMVKETSLASTFFIGELMSVNKTLTSSLYLTIEPLIVVGMIYFVVTFTLSKVVKLMEGRLSVSD